MMGQYIRESALVNGSFRCLYINLTTARSLQDIGKGGVSKAAKFAGLLCRIVRTVRRERPEIVYITPNACAPAFYKDYIIVQTLKRMGCRVVAHYHNKGVSTRQDRLVDDRLYRAFFRGIKLILLAEPLYDDVKKYVRREDVYICPNGIPDTTGAASRGHGAATASPGSGVPRLLFLSNLIPTKGVLVLLDACQALKERGYSFVCDFVGGETAEIDASHFAEEVRRRGLNGIAVYRGTKYGAEKSEAMEQADIFVFPSFYPNECFPLVNLEAMQHRLPVVSTDEGGIPTVVKDGENGFIAQRRDPQSLADCIARLLDSPALRTQMGEDGYRKYKEQFTLSTFETRLVEVLKNVLGGG